MAQQPTPKTTQAQSDHDLLIRISEIVQRMLRTIEGNGIKGLVARVDCLEDSVAEVKRDVSEIRDGFATQLVRANGELQTLRDIKTQITNHIQAENESRTKREKQEERHTAWWMQAGMEILKQAVAITGALLIAKLTGVI